MQRSGTRSGYDRIHQNDIVVGAPFFEEPERISGIGFGGKPALAQTLRDLDADGVVSSIRIATADDFHVLTGPSIGSTLTLTFLGLPLPTPYPYPLDLMESWR